MAEDWTHIRIKRQTMARLLAIKARLEQAGLDNRLPGDFPPAEGMTQDWLLALLITRQEQAWERSRAQAARRSAKGRRAVQGDAVAPGDVAVNSNREGGQE